MNTIVFHPESDPAAIQEAAAILRRGGLLGIPTETVYGLGADALNEDAVVRIFLAKGRPQDNPLIIHVPDASWLEQYCRDVPPEAYRLAERFWPGPLTMILPRRDIVPLQTTGGLETVGVRCPNHPVTLAIIEAAGVPIAAPSGNTSGRPSPHHRRPHDRGYGRQDRRRGGRRAVPCGRGIDHHRPDGDAPGCCGPAVCLWRPWRRCWGGIRGQGRHRPAGRRRASQGPGDEIPALCPHAPVTVATGTPDRSARRILGLLSDQAGVICFDEYARCMPGTSSIVWARRQTNPPRPGTYSTPCAPSTARTSRKFSPSAPMTGAWVWRWPTA